ncbi:cytochrome P450, partial [Lactarius deliciosus]
YLPRREYCCFRNYLGGIREVARGIVRKSIVKGDGRDIASVILHANNSRDPETKPPMARSLIRLKRFFLAGHDTSANPLTWFFWELAKHPESARDIREEIAAIRPRRHVNDACCARRATFVSALAAFDSAQPNLQESLHLIVWQLSRSAARDGLIPVAFPITTKSGEQISVIPIRKGARVDLSFCSHGRGLMLPEVWSEDADQWNSQRFYSVDIDQKNRSLYDCIRVSRGVRGCLGWRFAIIEMQVIAATLLENFEFSLPPQTAEHIIRKPVVLMVPMVEGIQYP